MQFGKILYGKILYGKSWPMALASPLITRSAGSVMHIPMPNRENIRRRLALVLVSLLLAPLTARSAPARSGSVDFNRDIRPVLSDNCFSCHGPDEKKRKGKLRLDVKDGMFADREGHPAVKPGNPQNSELWSRITNQDPDELMPPPKSEKKLTADQIALFKRWIEQGAKWQGHWAFEPPVKPEPPVANNLRWPRNEIDRFILASLEKRKLRPSAEASKEALIRRVTFDLTGLPPTLQEVREFLADRRADAYERLVDRLLDSPRYGEHMARYWLDAARYGDTHGLHLDNERSMWPYRDWVIGAFNRNERFDQFTIEQLAGDLLPNPTRPQLIASGFNRCNVTTSEGGSINEEFVYRYAVDRTVTMSEVWMGLTTGCAVCHDHKFDPITSKEFYSMYAFFNSAADPPMDGNILLTPPILKLTSPAQQKQLDDFDARIAAVEKRIREALAKVAYTDPGTLQPPPPIKKTETIWVDDEFPAGAKTEFNAGNHPVEWVTSPAGKVFSGKRALKRTDKGLAQDFFTGLPTPWIMPAGARIFAYAQLDPADLPKAIMLQFHIDGWSHRAVWGDVDAIEYGKKGTSEKMLMGPLPKAGEWVRLEINAAKLGLKAGTKISGLAYTQFGGTVYWDKTGVASEINPVTEPTESQLAWEKANQGKANKALPNEIETIFRSVPLKDRTTVHQKQLRDHYLEHVHSGTRAVFDPLHGELGPLRTKREEFDKSITATLIMKDLDQPRDSFVMVRGQYNKPGEPVQRNVPAAFPPLPKSGTTNRLDLARWLVSGRHPLTARVTVNRFWQQFFGTGIVETAGDFGSQGKPPSHPDLLDWLATTFVGSGWNVKDLVKLMVTSATYRQDSKVTPGLLESDPANRFFARGPRFRLDAEVIRDNALFVSELLDPKLGGKGVNPYQPENIWEPVAYSGSNTRVYKQDEGAALYRRSLYTFWKRTAPPPAMTTFDAPSRESSCVRRERSNTPLQALVLMNDVQHFEAARAFAQRMMTEGGAKAADRLAYGFQVVTSRKPNRSERSVLRNALERQLARYRANPDEAKQAVSYGQSKPAPDLDASELAAYALVANLLLNLDETVTKN